MSIKKIHKGIAIPMALLLVGALFALPRVTLAAAPTGSSAVVTNSTATTVDLVVTGANFSAFVSASSTTANATDTANITYRSTHPTSAVINSSTQMTLTFPIAIGTDKSGSLTLATSTVRDATSTPNALITIANGSITDTAAPQYSSSLTIDNNGDGTVDFVRVTYTEPISDASVAASDYAAGIATTTAGALTESFTSAVPASGVYTDTANDAVIYVGVTSGTETISTFKTDYALLIAQSGSVSDAAANALSSFTVKTSSDAAAPVVATDTLSGLASQAVTVEPSYTFSEAMDTASLTATNSIAVAYTQTWSNGNKTVTLNHATEFYTNETIVTTISAANAAAGTNVALSGLPYSSSFTTVGASTHHSGGGGGGGGGSHSNGGSSDASTGTTPSGTEGQLAALLAQLQTLQAQLALMTGGTAGGSTGSFTRDLTIGSQGEDVRALQVLLNAHGFAVAESGPGSKGNETTLFGGLTKAALAKWQASVGISPAAGYFGPKTRAAIAAL